MKKVLSMIFGLAVMLNMNAFAFAASDTIAPSDVENVKAVAGDSKVTLSFDAATDNVKVTGYKVYYGVSSVSKAGDKYTFGPKDVGDVLTTTISGLENDTRYYFAVTAYDAALNESANYSVEKDAIPEAGLVDGNDTVAPTVITAEAISKSEVEIEFSEKVVLPEDKAEQAFKVEDENTFELLDVLSAELVEDKDVETGKEGKIVKLTTATQEKDADYILTVSIDIEDLAGNPIISGTSDTASFVGTDAEPSDQDTVSPKVTKVEYMDSTNLIVTFSESMVLGLDPVSNFTVSEKDTPAIKADVSEVILGNNTTTGTADSSAILTVTELKAGTKYVVTVSDATDEAGNELDTMANSFEFTTPGGVTPDEPDEPQVTAPADANSFTAKLKAGDTEGAFSVLLSWMLPEGTTATSQKLYKSTDKGGSYENESILDMAKSEYETAKALAAGEYWFKLTQVGEDGTESKGVVAKVTLAETGPGIVGIIIASFGIGKVLTKKKKSVN